MSSNFKFVPIHIDISGYQENIGDVIQVSDVHNRARYIYTEWIPEKYAPTPLIIYNLSNSFKEKILKQLPDQILKKEVPGIFFMKMPKPCPQSEFVPPHVDRGRRAAINIYIECGGETTSFYDVDLENKTLVCKEQFTAKPNDIILLNVTVPHSVKMAESSYRSAITLSFRTSKFDQLSNILQ